MNTFDFYITLGYKHISDLAGYGHILFLVALCAIYKIEQWKKILILVTAFTIGHSITLVLASLDTITIPSHIIKFLIPTTIMLTAFHNILSHKPEGYSGKMWRNYAMALFFGLIHGMDFSNYFKALIMDPSQIVTPLLGFNIGIELGQLLVVACIVIIAFIFLNLISVKHRDWNLFISGAAAGMSFISMMDNKFW